ncbi:SRPBCC family protein [Rugamonas sp.]|uniref:SRPBCC family protein n=1 Tax=Rugamonas sp. TaxID=1926287 RepID=UPI00260116DF|nr:SRPBCC family protein [Rugamonas sp.]
MNNLKKSLTGLTLAAGALLSATAWAAPQLLHASQTVDIAAAPDRVWDLVKHYSDLTWVPLVKSSASTKGNTIGSVRTLDLGGPKLTEELVKYNAQGHSYTYAIQNTADNQKVVPLSDVKATISIAPGKNGGSLVTWQAEFHRADHADAPAAGRDDAAAQGTMGGVITAGLGGLKAKAEAL